MICMIFHDEVIPSFGDSATWFNGEVIVGTQTEINNSARNNNWESKLGVRGKNILTIFCPGKSSQRNQTELLRSKHFGPNSWLDSKCFQISLIQNLELFFLLITIMGTMISRDRSRVLYSGVTASRLLTGLSGEPVWWEHQYHRHRHYHHHRHHRHHHFTTIANTIIIITILSRPLTMTTGDISHQNIKHLQT